MNRNNSNIPKPVKASFWFLICSFLQKGISVVSTPIFARILSTSEYGTYNVFSSWLSIFTVFISLNLSAGVYTQGLVKLDTEEERHSFSSSLQGLTLLLTVSFLVLYCFKPALWNSLLKLSSIQIVAMVGIIWSTASYNFWAVEQRVKYDYKLLVFVTIIVSLAQPIIGVLFVLNSNDKVTARVIGNLLVCLVCYTPFFIIQMKKGRVLFSKKYWKYALVFNLPLVPHYLSQTVLNSADRIMIDAMVGASQAGIYSLAYSIANLSLLFNSALLHTLNPWIYQKIKENNISEIVKVGYISFVFIALVNIAVILIAPEILIIFAPDSYSEAVWVIPPIAMSVFFIFAYSFFAAFEFYYKKTFFIMIASVFGALLNIVLNYIFIPIFGYFAAGYTTLFCYIVYVCGHYILMKRVCRKYHSGTKVFNSLSVLCIAIVFLILGFFVMTTYNWPIIRYSVCLIALLICFLERKQLVKALKRLLEMKVKK